MPGKTWQRWNWIEAAALPLLGALTWSVWAGLPIAGLFDFVTDHHASIDTTGDDIDQGPEGIEAKPARVRVVRGAVLRCGRAVSCRRTSRACRFARARNQS